MNIVEGKVLFLDAKYKSHNIIHDRQKQKQYANAKKQEIIYASPSPQDKSFPLQPLSPLVSL